MSQKLLILEVKPPVWKTLAFALVIALIGYWFSGQIIFVYVLFVDAARWFNVLVAFALGGFFGGLVFGKLGVPSAAALIYGVAVGFLLQVSGMPQVAPELAIASAMGFWLMAYLMGRGVRRAA